MYIYRIHVYHIPYILMALQELFVFGNEILRSRAMVAGRISNLELNLPYVVDV